MANKLIFNHIGEEILQVLKDRKIKQNALCKKTGISTSELNEIIKGKRNLSWSVSLKLENIFILDAKEFMKKQVDYDYELLKNKF